MKTVLSRLAPVVASVAVLGLLTGCGANHSSLERDKSAKVKLDVENVKIYYPLNEFQVSDNDRRIINRAIDTAMSKCLAKAGFSNVQNFDPNREYPVSEDRFYGLWSVKNASIYGYDIPGKRGDSNASKPSEQQLRAQTDCRINTKEELRAFTAVDAKEEQQSKMVAERIRMDASTAAHNTDEWKQAKQKWRACLSSKGLTPKPDEASWISKQGEEILGKVTPGSTPPEVKKEEIRIAIIEATCNQETNLTQTLGDIEASYQAPLIAKNRAALNKEKEATQAKVAAAKKYLAENQ